MRVGKTSRKLTAVLLLMLVFTFVLTGVVYADSGITINVPPSDGAKLAEIFSNLRKQEKFAVTAKAGETISDGTMWLEYSGNAITFNKEIFDKATEKSKKQALGEFVKALKESDVAPQTQQMIFEQLGEVDRNVNAILITMMFDSTNADVYTAYRWLAPFLSILRVILGILSVCIIAMTIIVTAGDLMYMSFPAFRVYVKEGEEKPWFLSYDAIAAVKEVEASLGESGKLKNVFWVYMKSRAWSYVAVSVCVLYLVVGEIGTLIGRLLGLASGIVQ